MIKQFLFAAAVDLNLPDVATDQDRLQTIMNVVFGIMGAVAVLIVVLAGIRYITSQGDPQATATARRAIIYAAIGLAVLVMAFAIVTFVLNVL